MGPSYSVAAVASYSVAAMGHSYLLLLLLTFTNQRGFITRRSLLPPPENAFTLSREIAHVKIGDVGTGGSYQQPTQLI